MRRQKLSRNYGTAMALNEETAARKVNNATIAVDYTLSLFPANAGRSFLYVI